MTILMYLPSFTSPVLFLTLSTFYIYVKIWGSGFSREERKSRLKLWECIGKPKILCAALIPLSFTGLQMPNRELSCFHQVCPPPSRKSSPSQLISLLAKTAETQLVFNLMNFTSLSACKKYQTSQLHTSTENSATSFSYSWKSWLLQTMLIRSAPRCILHVVLHGVRCLSSPGCGYMWLKNCCQSLLSSVGCHVFEHLILFRVWDPSLTNKVNRGWPEQRGQWNGSSNHNISITHLADTISSFWLKGITACERPDTQHTVMTLLPLLEQRKWKTYQALSQMILKRKENNKMDLTESKYFLDYVTKPRS